VSGEHMPMDCRLEQLINHPLQMVVFLVSYGQC